MPGRIQLLSDGNRTAVAWAKANDEVASKAAAAITLERAARLRIQRGQLTRSNDTYKLLELIFTR
jgi:hypothetical protein